MTNSESRVGIVLTAGYVSEKARQNAASQLKIPYMERKFNAPNATGLARAMAGRVALNMGYIDKLYVLGGMPDDHNIPVEIGHRERLAAITDEPKRVHVLPRPLETVETVADLEQALSILKDRGEDTNLTIISDKRHLRPRTALAMKILGYPQTKFLSTEFLLQTGALYAEAKSEIEVPVISEYTGVKAGIYEYAATGILALDLLPGNMNLGRRAIRHLAMKQRAK